jgi:hypothetical protein
MSDPEFAPLTSFLEKVPAISGAIAVGAGNGSIAWWVKFTIDVSAPLAWRAVEELAHVFNYLSVNERLPTVFMPCLHPHI